MVGMGGNSMNRSFFMYGVLIIIGMTVLGTTSWYFLPYFYHWSQNCTEQEAIAYMEHEIISFKSLNFSSSSEIITMLESYVQQLKERNGTWHSGEFDCKDGKKHEALIAVNKKMLQTYMKDLQEYAKKGSASENNIIQFSYDKVIRLTIALAELEQYRNEGLPSEEYMKKIDRMHEITQQAITHSKRMLRSYFHNGLKEDHPKVQAERNYITSKVHHLIELDKIVYL